MDFAVTRARARGEAWKECVERRRVRRARLDERDEREIFFFSARVIVWRTKL